MVVLRAPPYQEDACDQQQIDDKRNERQTYKYQLSKDDDDTVDDYTNTVGDYTNTVDDYTNIVDDHINTVDDCV